MKNIVLILLFILTSIRAYSQVLNETILDDETRVKKRNCVYKSHKGQIGLMNSIDQCVELNQAPPIEKIFLHLDRPNYMLGDTIWFKAYSWFGYGQEPDTLSRVMYVDLISGDGKTGLRRKLLIENGTSSGDFVLDTIIPPGSYTLRAYTRWMQNGNTGEPFYQTINISPLDQNLQVECSPVILKQAGIDSLKINFRFLEVAPTGDLKNAVRHRFNCSLKVGERILRSGYIEAENAKGETFMCSLSGLGTKDTVAVFDLSVKEKGLTYQKQVRIPIREGIDLQFFPEGGRLVIGVESKVAFKAIGEDGLSRTVKGKIETAEGELVSGFETLHKGMGFFLLKPKLGEKYFASIWHGGRNYVIPLPRASNGGVVMSVGPPNNDRQPVILRQGSLTAPADKYIVGSAYGKIWFWGSTRLMNDSAVIQVPLDLLPQGVCRLTVLNRDFRPECERLVYIDKGENINIELRPDSSSYGKRSKVTLLIKTTDFNGEPLQSNVSIAVVDQQQVSKEVQNGGIAFYKLVESELKGNVEDPGYYFKDGRSVNNRDLDLLMLTQGYRQFLPDTTEQKFQPERSFDVQGKIKADGSKSRAEKYNYWNVGLTLLTGSDIPYFNFMNPDSLGRFAFQIPLQHGRLKSTLKATRDGKRPFYGEIAVDEPFMPKFARPVQINTNTSLPVIELVQRLQAARKSQLKTIDLPEVTVKGRARNWYHDLETRTKKILELDSIDPHGNKYKSIYDLLIREYGAKWYSLNHTIVLPCIRYGGGGNTFFPIYLIDGHIYWNGEDKDLSPLEHLSSYDVDQIKRIMVIPPEKLPIEYAATWIYNPIGGGPHISQSTVVIETYGSAFYRGQKPGMKTFILDGLDQPRAFYSPKYEGVLKENKAYDGRATLFWKPSLKTDSEGQARVEFYTSDRQTTLDVIIKGMEVSSGRTGDLMRELQITE